MKLFDAKLVKLDKLTVELSEDKQAAQPKGWAVLFKKLLTRNKYRATLVISLYGKEYKIRNRTEQMV